MILLITGANGQVGHALARQLSSLGDVVSLDRQGADLSRSEHLIQVLDSVKPDWIINAAAYTAVDKAETERELAFQVNAIAPGVIAKWAAANEARLIHYSTDYVFDGRLNRPYVETDNPAPINVYGESKLAGEEAVLSSQAKAWVLRTTWVYSAHGANFIKTILRLAQERHELGVVNDQFGAPTSATWIAAVTRKLILAEQAKASPTPGVYHLSAAGSTNWHEYAVLVISYAQQFGLALKTTLDHVVGIPSSAYPMPAVRPMNSRLDSSKLMRVLGIHSVAWRQEVLCVVKEILEKRNSDL